MSVTVDDLLNLAGRLDDEPGFDSPRERFRRFLVAHVTTPALARMLIEQCQHAPSEQHHRALQDLVVLTGRFLGFDTTFGTYGPLAGAVRYDGQWQSRTRLNIVVEVRWDHLIAPGVESLLRSVSAVAATSMGRGLRTAGLCVVVQPHSGRNRIDEAIAAAHAGVPLSTIALYSLLLLADTISAGGALHDDIVRMIDGSMPIDFVVGMIEKAQGKTSASPTDAAPAATAGSASADLPRYWITSVGADHATRPEEFLELVVGRRQIYGIIGSPASPHLVKPGDFLCFYINGRGIVGHAGVGSLVENANVIRDAHRFRQLVHVEDVTLHTADPYALDAESQRLMQRAGNSPSRVTQPLVAISRETFRSLTNPPRVAADDRTRKDSGTAIDDANAKDAPASVESNDRSVEADDAAAKDAPSKPPSIGASRRRR